MRFGGNRGKHRRCVDWENDYRFFIILFLPETERLRRWYQAIGLSRCSPTTERYHQHHGDGKAQSHATGYEYFTSLGIFSSPTFQCRRSRTTTQVDWECSAGRHGDCKTSSSCGPSCCYFWYDWKGSAFGTFFHYVIPGRINIWLTYFFSFSSVPLPSGKKRLVFKLPRPSLRTPRHSLNKNQPPWFRRHHHHHPTLIYSVVLMHPAVRMTHHPNTRPTFYPLHPPLRLHL